MFDYNYTDPDNNCITNRKGCLILFTREMYTSKRCSLKVSGVNLHITLTVKEVIYKQDRKEKY